MVVLPGVSRPWVSEGSQGSDGFFVVGPGDCPGTGLVRIHCWLDVKSCFFVEDLYFVWRGLPEKIIFRTTVILEELEVGRL